MIPQLPETDQNFGEALAGDWHGPLMAVLPEWLAGRRWFGDRDKGGLDLRPLIALTPDLVLARLDLAGGAQTYFLPLALSGEEGRAPIARASDGRALVDAADAPTTATALIGLMRNGARPPLHAEGAALLVLPAGPARPLAADQSNSAHIIGDAVLLKIYRRLHSGPQPEVEMARHLTRIGFHQTPRLLGEVVATEEDETMTLAAAYAYLPNQGDAWVWLGRELEDDPAPAAGMQLMRRLGAVLGGLHRALLASDPDPDFAARPITQADLGRWVDEAARDLRDAFRDLDRADLPDSAVSMAAWIRPHREDLACRIEAVRNLGPEGWSIRIHGDLHLGQVLVRGREVAIIDFEGEPRRSIADRRALGSGLRDLAGLLRSLDYAARLHDADADWRNSVLSACREAYARAAGVAIDAALLDLFLIQKAAYEISYELAHRPDWVHLPVAGLLALTKEGANG